MIKKSLLLIPLLMLSGCINKGESKVYQNVEYSFIFENRQYEIKVKETNETYYVNVEKVYYIYDYSRHYTNDNGLLYNEFYTNPNKLYIYNIK